MKKNICAIDRLGCFFCFSFLSLFLFQPAAFAAASAHYETIQKVYIGYYQRPADPAGLIYWAERLDSAGGNLTGIIEAFAHSDESQALYGAIDSSTIAGVVNAIYKTLFGRDAEVAGRDWYVNEFNEGRFTAATIMLNVLYGAQGADLQSITNKLAASTIFTQIIDPELDGADFQVTYAGDADAIAARNFLTVYATADKSPTQAETTAYLRANISDSEDALAPTITPVILVHGSGGATSEFMKLYEYFTGMGFPEDKIFLAIMPRLGSCTGSNTQSACNSMSRTKRQQWAMYTPKTGEAYSRTAWSGQGNTVYNVPALDSLISSVLVQTGASEVKLVGHGYGTYAIREFLTSASYATNRAKVRKAIFIAGAADIESNNSSNRIYTYLKDVASDLPDGIDYYAVTSNADYVRISLKSYAGDAIFNKALYPRAVNYSDADGLVGYDTKMLVSGETPVKKMYAWLTGNTAGAPADKSVVDIGGIIVDRGATTDYLQTAVAGAAVKISYYSNTTGAVTQADVCSTTTDVNGKWSCTGLAAAEYFKVSVSFNSKTMNLFLAEQIKQNSKLIAINIPGQSAKSAGQVFVGVLNSAEFFSDHLYPADDANGKPATALTATITNGGAATYNMDANTVTSSDPSEYTATYFLNWTGTATNTTSGGNLYNFGGNYSDFAGQTATFTCTLNSKSAKIQFNGDDFISATVPYVWYTY